MLSYEKKADKVRAWLATNRHGMKQFDLATKIEVGQTNLSKAISVTKNLEIIDKALAKIEEIEKGDG